MPKHLESIGRCLYLYSIKQQQLHFLNLHTMSNDQQIAQTILNQLGGISRLNIMLGLKDLMTVKNGVSFKIKFAGAAANYVKIQLNGLDLYDVEIGKIRGLNYTVKAKEGNVYFDGLKPLIENTCKVRLSL